MARHSLAIFIFALAVSTLVQSQQASKPDIFDRVCEKNISFAWVPRGGEVVSETPDFASKWVAKNSSKHPNLCFGQSPVSGISNYLLVFSSSVSAYRGVHPTIKTTTTVNPISGDGRATDSQGNTWSYTFEGSATTTTTTNENVPYTDTSNTLFLRSYTQYGKLISERWYTFTRRQGGDDGDTAVFNVVSSLRGFISNSDSLASSFRTSRNIPRRGTLNKFWSWSRQQLEHNQCHGPFNFFPSALNLVNISNRF